MHQRDLDRFMRKFYEDNNGCWIWTDYCVAQGYGRFSIKSVMYQAHKVSYEHFVGPVPEGLEIDHMCKVRGCVNPEHLQVITHKENVPRRRTIVTS